MTALHPVPTPIHRPRLLVRAARFGLLEYERDRVLRRLFHTLAPPAPSKALPMLLEREAELDAQRLDRAATYSAARHIEVLIALMGEMRLSAAIEDADQAKASGSEALRRAT